LAAFDRAQDKLQAEGICVIAGSTDPQEKAAETVAELGLGMPVGYGLPLKDTAAEFGAFYEEKRGVLQATGFVVRPDRTIAVAQYSSGAHRAPRLAGRAGPGPALQEAGPLTGAPLRHTTDPKKGGRMEIVHVTDVHELAPEDQKFCEATKAWFKIDFVPKMSRVLLTVPEFGRPYGRASRRAMSDGALSRAQKELIASVVSAINVCEY
jgi:hypothetical protein